MGAVDYYQLAGFVGVILEVGAYAALQLGFLHGNGYIYAFANLVASVFLLISLTTEFNLSYLVTEIIWIFLSVYGMARMYWLGRQAHLSAEETAFVSRMFPTMSRTMAHSFVSAGGWHDAEAGTRLATEGEKMGALIYLASGEAEILSDWGTIARCLPGSFIGELSCFDGSPASASVVLAKPARYFRIATEALNGICAHDFEMRNAVQHAVGKDTGKKLVEANARLREAVTV